MPERQRSRARNVYNPDQETCDVLLYCSALCDMLISFLVRIFSASLRKLFIPHLLLRKLTHSRPRLPASLLSFAPPCQ